MKQVVAIIGFMTAIAVLTTAAYHAIERKRVVFRQAEGAFESQDYARAVSLYEELQEEVFQEQKVVEHLLEAYLATGKPGMALGLGRRFFDRQRRTSDTFVQFGETFIRYKAFKEAAEILRMGIADPYTLALKIRET